MSDHVIRTISNFSESICGTPTHTDMFTVYSIQKSDEVFKGTWEELLDSEYADIELASWDLAPRDGVLICFNLDDEDYDYGDGDNEDYYDHDWIAGDDDYEDEDD